MKSTFSRIVLLVLLISCIFWISCGKDNPVDSSRNVANTDYVAKESFSFKVEVKDHTRLKLEAINGNVKITGLSESDSIIITGEKRVGSESIEDAEEYLQFLKVSVEELVDEVFVKTTQPEKSYGRSYVVDYAITLPKNLEILASNVNGSVTIDSINNDVTIGNINGLITLNEIFGSAIVGLTNGEIDGKVTLPSNGTITMSLVNGNIDLNIPVNTSAQFTASVTNGNIAISNIVLQNQVSSATSLRGTLGAGQGTISLSTVNGNIIVGGF